MDPAERPGGRTSRAPRSRNPHATGLLDATPLSDPYEGVWLGVVRIPNSSHTYRQWRVHEIVDGFLLDDVWALPTPGHRNDFPLLVELMTSLDPSRNSVGLVRALFALRWKVGAVLGWDDDKSSVGSRVTTLRMRLPADLREGPTGPRFEALPFTPLYLTDDEFAAEIANRTMHGVMHLGWVPEPTGGYRGEMAVYVRRHGVFGTAYMAAIQPLRHLVVYPLMMRQLQRAWRNRAQDGRRHRTP